jgi:hypothetical protein
MHSAEIRWFFDEQLPHDVDRWFCSEALCHSEDPRTDAYLRLPGCESVGIKLREGNLEVKALCGSSRDVAFGNDVGGITSTWVKWSLKDPLVLEFGRVACAGADPIEVEKTRRLLKYSLDDGDPVPIAADCRPRSGCNVELTKIEILKRPWWSFALEAFGSPAEVDANLLKAATSYFSTHPAPCRLSTVTSRSYPAWLATLIERS